MYTAVTFANVLGRECFAPSISRSSNDQSVAKSLLIQITRLSDL